MPENIDSAIPRFNLEITMLRIQPAVQNLYNLQLNVLKCETARFLIAAIPGIAFNMDVIMTLAHETSLTPANRRL
jgi:hypothetical protein